MNNHLTSSYSSWLTRCLALILVLLPFNAFLTIILSAFAGHYDLLRLWKEMVLLALTPVAGMIFYKTPKLRQEIKRDWLFWCLGSFIVLHIALGLVALARGQVNTYALGFSLIVNLRFLLIFCLAYVAATRSSWLRSHWEQLLLWPAVAVIGFGLLQTFVLPVNFLQSFGYNQSTIAPYETVDQKLDYVRVQSTLRGANPLGAYLVLAITAIVVLLLKSKRDQRQIMGTTALSAGLIVLVSTYSRSAYVGMALAALMAILLVVHGRKAKLRLAYVLAGLAIVGAVALVTMRNNDQFQNAFFHTDETSKSSRSSNDQHASAFKSGVKDIIHEPFGRGPGTAGPASVHNNAPARIAESYYLQIGQETGLLGMALFIAIIIMVGRRLYALRSDPLARTLLASLVGLSFVNLTLHAWTDDTLALIWWGLAGIALAVASPAIIRPEPPKTNSKN